MIADGHSMYHALCEEFEMEQLLCNFHAILMYVKNHIRK